MNPFMKFFWYQLFYHFFRLCHFFFLVPNFPSILFTSIVLSFFGFFFFSFSLFYSFSSCFLPSSSFFSSSFCFYHPNFPYFRIVASKPQHFQNHTPLLTSNYIDLHLLPIFLIVSIYLHYILNRSLLIKGTIHISYIYQSFNFLQLKSLLPCKLWTHD